MQRFCCLKKGKVGSGSSRWQMGFFEGMDTPKAFSKGDFNRSNKIQCTSTSKLFEGVS